MASGTTAGLDNASAKDRAPVEPRISEASGDTSAPQVEEGPAASCLTYTQETLPHPDIAAAWEGVVFNTRCCVGLFDAAVAGFLNQLHTYRSRWLAEAQALCHERVKALEAQEDELYVTAGQLAACVVLGRAALARGANGAAHVQTAATSAVAVRGLTTANARPRVETRMAVVVGMSDRVDAGRSSASGFGLGAFVRGDRARNCIRVECRDSDNAIAEFASANDVGLIVRGVGGSVQAGHLASAAVVRPGVVDLTYVVTEEYTDEVELCVLLHGVTVPGGPWRARNDSKAAGVYVCTLAIHGGPLDRGFASLAVTRDGSIMVLSNPTLHGLSVYATSNGGFVRSFGSLGTAAGQFDRPAGLCMTPHGTVLVGDSGNQRVQEMTLEGTHVKHIGVGSIDAGVGGVDMRGDVVAVGKSGNNGSSRVMLFNYASGALIRQFGEYGYLDGQYARVSGIRFAQDGNHLLICGGGPVTVTTVEGVFVRCIGKGVLSQGNCHSVAPLSLTEIVIADVFGSRACVFSLADGALLRSWDFRDNHGRQFAYPNALTISYNRLYVMSQHPELVHVFE